MTEQTKKEPSMFELYKLFQETTEKVSDRRAKANTWMLSVNSALVALYTLLEQGEAFIGTLGQRLWLVAIPVAGVIICLAWYSLHVSYRKLNHAKFSVLMDMEKNLPYALYTREKEFLDRNRRWNLSNIESWIPLAFGLLYIFLGLVALAL